jgi:hypothetical protein
MVLVELILFDNGSSRFLSNYKTLERAEETSSSVRDRPCFCSQNTEHSNFILHGRAKTSNKRVSRSVGCAFRPDDGIFGTRDLHLGSWENNVIDKKKIQTNNAAARRS